MCISFPCQYHERECISISIRRIRHHGGYTRLLRGRETRDQNTHDMSPDVVSLVSSWQLERRSEVLISRRLRRLMWYSIPVLCHCWFRFGEHEFLKLMCVFIYHITITIVEVESRSREKKIHNRRDPAVEYKEINVPVVSLLLLTATTRARVEKCTARCSNVFKGFD